MITKENFCRIINKIRLYDAFTIKVGNYVRLEKFDGLFIPGEIQDMFFNILFTEEQVDTINAYLYEFDYFQEEISDSVKTPEELYDYLISNQFPSSE